MGHESEEYVPLVSNSPALEQGFEHHKPIRATALREKVLLIIVLMQAVALIAAAFILVTRGTAVSGPGRDRPLVYCECNRKSSN
jgi:hypothetical protein